MFEKFIDHFNPWRKNLTEEVKDRELLAKLAREIAQDLDFQRLTPLQSPLELKLDFNRIPEPEVGRTSAAHQFLRLLELGDEGSARNLKEAHNLEPADFEGIHESRIQAVIRCVRDGRHQPARNIIEWTGLSEERVHQAIEPAFRGEILHGSFEAALRLADYVPAATRETYKLQAVNNLAQRLESHNIQNLDAIIQKFGVTPKDLSGPETLERCRRALRSAIYRGRSEIADLIISAAGLSEDDTATAAIGAAKEIIRDYGWTQQVDTIFSRFIKQNAGAPNPKIIEAGKSMLEACIASGSEGSIAKICTLCNLPQDTLQSIVWNRISKLFAQGWSGEIGNLVKKYKLTDSPIPELPGLKVNAVNGIIYNIKNDCLDDAKKIMELMKLSASDLKGYVEAALIGGTDAKQADKLLKMFAVPENTPVTNFIQNLSGTDQAWITQFELKTFGEVMQFKSTHSVYVTWLRNSERRPNLTPQELALLRSNSKAKTQTLPITDVEADELKAARVDLVDIHAKNDYAKLFTALTERTSAWAHAVGRDTLKTAEKIGFKQALECLYDPEKTHGSGGLADFSTIDRLTQLSGRSATQVVSTILGPLKGDNSKYGVWKGGYDTGLYDARTEFNKILERCQFDVERVQAAAKRYPEIELLQASASKFPNRASAFASWKAMRQFAKLEKAVKDEQFMADLVELKEKNPKLYVCLSNLYFHPDSNLNADTLRQFWKDPLNFFKRDANYTDSSLHQAIQPSRMCDGKIRALDLAPEEVRDSLINGAYDKLMTFTPLRIEYQIPKSGTWYESTRDAIKGALGERSKGISGRAKDIKLLFHELKQKLKEKGVDILAYVKGEQEAPAELDGWLRERVYNEKTGIQETWLTVIATLHSKSDPIGIIAGDDTACCMPFGEGKNNDYFADPNVGLFTLRMQLEDGTIRTIAQSVSAKELSTGKHFRDIDQYLKSSSTNMAEVLSNAPNHTGPLTITLDNIEPAKNYATEFLNRIVQATYGDFFAQYADRFGDQEALEQRAVYIGHAYTQAHQGLEFVDDQTLSITAPIGYSDRTADRYHTGVYRLPLKVNRFLFRTSIEGPEKGNSSVGRTVDNTPGIRPLTYVDTVPVAYLRGKYPDQSSCEKGIQALKVLLVATAINNEIKERPNLSLKYTDSQGFVKGALVAYEGRINDKKVVVVNGLTTEPSQPQITDELLNAFCEKFKSAYSDPQGRPKIEAKNLQNEIGKKLKEMMQGFAEVEIG